MEIDPQALLAQLDAQNVEMGRMRLMLATYQAQLEARDAEIAELKKKRPTKRTAK